MLFEIKGEIILYGILILVVYLMLMLSLTVLFTEKEQDSVMFHVGNRKISAGVSAMSIAATWIWAPALLVSAEQAYTHGIVGLFWFIVPNILCLLLFIPFAKKIRQQMPHGMTLSGYMAEKYHSKAVKRVYLFQLSALAVLSTGVQLLAGGKILTTITGLPLSVITIILAAIAFSYAQFSGLKASVLTDALQMILMILACIIMIPLAISINDGFQPVINGLNGISREYNSLFSPKGLEVFWAFGLPTAIGLIAGPFGDQCFWQRAFAVKQNKIGKAFLGGAILFAVIPLSMGILGFIAAGSNFIPISQGTVNFELIGYLFPQWVMILFVFMLISGLMSTIDSNLCAIAALTNDWNNVSKQTNQVQLKIAKVAMIILLLMGIIMANIPNLSVTHLFLIYGTLRATTLLPTVLTLLERKLSAQGISIGIIVAMVLGLPIFAYGTLCNLSLYKTIGCLTAVLSSGLVALLISRIALKRDMAKGVSEGG